LVDRTRIAIPDTKIVQTGRSIGGPENNPAPSLVDLQTSSEPRLESAQPDLLSPTIELPPDIMDEGVHGRRSAPAVPALDRGEGSVIPSLPEDQALSLSPATPVNVLVVDDNHINLRLLLTYLSRRNITNLDSAENGKMAVEAVEKRMDGYDIIFMDISMPVMNGFEATRAIRSLENERDERRPATIIALTGLSSARDETEAMTSGVDLFLTKPVSLKEVSRLLDEWHPKQQTDN
jgi:CheY-like chemotaxis protein